VSTKCKENQLLVARHFYDKNLHYGKLKVININSRSGVRIHNHSFFTARRICKTYIVRYMRWNSVCPWFVCIYTSYARNW